MDTHQLDKTHSQLATDEVLIDIAHLRRPAATPVLEEIFPQGCDGNVRPAHVDICRKPFKDLEVQYDHLCVLKLQKWRENPAADLFDPKGRIDQRDISIRPNGSDWFATLKEEDILDTTGAIYGAHYDSRITSVTVDIPEERNS